MPTRHVADMHVSVSVMTGAVSPTQHTSSCLSVTHWAAVDCISALTTPTDL